MSTDAVFSRSAKQLQPDSSRPDNCWIPVRSLSGQVTSRAESTHGVVLLCHSLEPSQRYFVVSGPEPVLVAGSDEVGENAIEGPWPNRIVDTAARVGDHLTVRRHIER